MRRQKSITVRQCKNMKKKMTFGLQEHLKEDRPEIERLIKKAKVLSNDSGIKSDEISDLNSITRQLKKSVLLKTQFDAKSHFQSLQHKLDKRRQVKELKKRNEVVKKTVIQNVMPIGIRDKSNKIQHWIRCNGKTQKIENVSPIKTKDIYDPKQIKKSCIPNYKYKLQDLFDNPP